jgi:hypothetical protein
MGSTTPSTMLVPGPGGGLVPAIRLGPTDDAGAPGGNPCCEGRAGCSWTSPASGGGFPGYMRYLIGCVVTGKLAQPDECQCGQPICPYGRGQL